MGKRRSASKRKNLVAFETRSSEETVEKESPPDNSPVPLEYAGGARNRCSTDPDTVVALWRTLARSRQKRNRSSFFRFANMGSTVGVQTWREQLYKCRREREERRSRTSGILAECENLRGLCTNSSSSPSSSPREGALFQLEPPRPVERDLRERDPIVYIYIKPPFIRDNKQSCYRREINIVTFIRGQIEGANEPAIACVSLHRFDRPTNHFSTPIKRSGEGYRR